MPHPVFIEIDGKRFVWRELVQRRRAQLQAAARAVQPALFELRDDSRPATERTAARRYLEPSLFTLPLPGDTLRRGSVSYDTGAAEGGE